MPCAHRCFVDRSTTASLTPVTCAVQMQSLKRRDQAAMSYTNRSHDRLRSAAMLSPPSPSHPQTTAQHQASLGGSLCQPAFLLVPPALRRTMAAVAGLPLLLAAAPATFALVCSAGLPARHGEPCRPPACPSPHCSYFCCCRIHKSKQSTPHRLLSASAIACQCSDAGGYRATLVGLTASLPPAPGCSTSSIFEAVAQLCRLAPSPSYYLLFLRAPKL
jgi:hypothetical protein